MSLTYAEITNQPRAWEQTLRDTGEQWRRIATQISLDPQTHFLFVGCGTSLYIAQCAAHTFQEITGHVATAVPGSEVFLSPDSTVPRAVPVLAFVISRSGATSEAVSALDDLNRRPHVVATVAITCTTGTALAARATYAVELPHAEERSVVMTQSFTSMLLALQTIAAIVAEDEALQAELTRLPRLLSDDLGRQERFAELLGRNTELQRFIYLGLGPNAPLAEEGALKLKEMTQTPCEAYNPLEFRHGPISVVDPGTAVILLQGRREEALTPAVGDDVRSHGAYLATLAPGGGPNADLALEMPADLSDIARCVLYLPPLQLLAYHRALTVGLDPDRPRYLNQVVKLGPGRSAEC